MSSKYEVSIFNHSEDIEGVQKFQMGHLGVNFSSAERVLNIVYLYAKFGVQKLYFRSHILKLGHVTLATPTLWDN